MVNAIKAAIGDAVITFMWVFISSTFGLLTTETIKRFDLQYLISPFSPAFSYNGFDQISIMITTLLIFFFMYIFNIIGHAFGGASFNPAGNASSYAAGLGDDTLFSMALRFPAQALGAVGGAVAIMEVMPPKYRHMIGGPALKVDIHTGAVAEGVLTFAITFIGLFIMLRGPNSELMKTSMMAMSIVTFIVAGSTYTGPSLNPALAYGWAYLDNWHNTWDHFYVYWICPFIGSILAAWVYRAVFPPRRVVKQKKA